MIAREVSDFIARLAFRIVARTLFRVRIVGKEHIPTRGPALLVANHLTYLDGFLIGSCVGPMVRFLVWKPYYENPLLNWGFRLGRSIPISTKPHSVAEAIRLARGELVHADVICIFPEGSISRTGALLPFKRGLEAIVRDIDARIIPVHLGGLWESVFSYRGGRFFWKRPRWRRQPVVISFGPAMPPSSTASEVRWAVEQLQCAQNTVPNFSRPSALVPRSSPYG
jgi:acyl-[acyl-carrier-protein]-phospholipid O-acyltransferase / long-chain-fatty-acid--[acyl-carrier-protein] ligase